MVGTQNNPPAIRCSKKLWLCPQPNLKKRIQHHNWDSPRNLHFDVPKLVLARAKSMYLELVPSEGQSQYLATIPAFISNFLVFCDSISAVSHWKNAAHKYSTLEPHSQNKLTSAHILLKSESRAKAI